ncbi:MAG: peroxide stress protein YaaA [Candidatus Poribacteria bacterium]|nr:peroxide stress protein YaaA [Candidatus Poribacteria bacterium]
MTKALLIIGCSQRKVSTHPSQTLYAMYRYDGPTYRCLRKLYREGRFPDNLDVLIISARYGLLQWREPILNYEQKMTAARADELRPFVQERLKEIVTVQQYDQVFINLGKRYMRTLADFHWGNLISTMEASGGIGQKTQQMKVWLEQIYGR